MRVLIIGINHQIQPSDILSWSSSGALERFERGQKDAFARLIQAKIEERGVQYVAEESTHGQQSVANRCRKCMTFAMRTWKCPRRGGLADRNSGRGSPFWPQILKGRTLWRGSKTRLS
jgi:hypothetical protein